MNTPFFPKILEQKFGAAWQEQWNCNATGKPFSQKFAKKIRRCAARKSGTLFENFRKERVFRSLLLFCFLLPPSVEFFSQIFDKEVSRSLLPSHFLLPRSAEYFSRIFDKNVLRSLSPVHFLIAAQHRFFSRIFNEKTFRSLSSFHFLLPRSTEFFFCCCVVDSIKVSKSENLAIKNARFEGLRG